MNGHPQIAVRAHGRCLSWQSWVLSTTHEQRDSRKAAGASRQEGPSPSPKLARVVNAATSPTLKWQCHSSCSKQFGHTSTGEICCEVSNGALHVSAGDWVPGAVTGAPSTETAHIQGLNMLCTWEWFFLPSSFSLCCVHCVLLHICPAGAPPGGEMQPQFCLLPPSTRHQPYCSAPTCSYVSTNQDGLQ
jgi:hypothetical protein